MSCQHWTLRCPAPVPELMRKGYGRCAHAHIHTYHAPSATCEKHEPAPNDIVSKRRKYLKGLG
jgi:hypothetical protein